MIKVIAAAAMMALLISCGKEVENQDKPKSSHSFHKAETVSESQSLLNALEANESLMVREALKSTPIDSILPGGETPLTYALKNNKLYILKEILENNPDLNLKNKFGEAPLHLALESKSKARVTLMLRAGPDLDIEDNTGDSALIKAIELHDESSAIELIIKGAKLQCLESAHSYCPELIIARGARLEAVSKLIQDIKKIRNRELDRDLVKEVVTTNNSSLLSYLFENRSLLKKANGMNLIDLALDIENDLHRSKLLKLMLSYGMSPNGEKQDSSLPILKAVKNNDLQAAAALLHAGADPNFVDDKGNTPLMYASNKLFYSMANLLIRGYNAQVTFKQNNNVYDACSVLPDTGSFFFRRLNNEESQRRYELIELMHCFQY